MHSITGGKLNDDKPTFTQTYKDNKKEANHNLTMKGILSAPLFF